MNRECSHSRAEIGSLDKRQYEIDWNVTVSMVCACGGKLEWMIAGQGKMLSDEALAAEIEKHWTNRADSPDIFSDWYFIRPDGIRARCAGPGKCSHCVGVPLEART